MKNFKHLLPSFLLISFLGIGLSFLLAGNAQAETVKIIRACSSGLFVRYTDCDSGKAISRSALAPGKHRFGSISADGQSFKVLITGGDGVYKVLVSLSNGQTIYIADYPAKANYVNLTAEAKKLGWTASGVEIFAPKKMSSEDPIKYPIEELGNCKDKDACKKYCEAQEHYLACADFGEKNNLISKEEAAKAREFADVLKGEGPGGCKDKASCEKYCEDLSHIDDCLSFAQKHNFLSGEQLEGAKKISQAVKSGAVMPGGCKDKTSCDSYCKDLTHIDECLAFAEKAGTVSAEEIAEAKKVLPLIKSGQSPGGCKSKEECMKYCDDENHGDECVNFAEKAGFVTKEEAEMARKTGGKGPGNCKSKEACDAFCNKKENQKECFDFAKKYNLIPEDKLKEMEEGMGRLRAGLEQMPKEAIQCLKEKLGEGVISEIQNGSFMPGPETGDVIQGCMEKILPKLQEKLQKGLEKATPEVLECLKSQLGEENFGKLKSGDISGPEAGDIIKKCFNIMMSEGLKRMKEALAKMPPEMKDCIKEKMGADKFGKIEKGEDVEIGSEIEDMIQSCVGNIENTMQNKMDEAMKQVPPEMRECVQSKLGDITKKIKSGEVKESDIPALIQECVSTMIPKNIPSIPEGIKIPSDISIPSGIPSAKDIESLKELQKQYQDMPQGPPSNIPQGPPANIPQGPPANIPTPPSGMPKDIPSVPQKNIPSVEIPKPSIPVIQGPDCSSFTSVPDCSFVPSAVQSICKQCKGQ